MLYIRHNLLLIHMRKTGGTSLEHALGESDDSMFADEQSFHKNSSLLKGRIQRPFPNDKHTPLRSYRKHLDPGYFKQLTVVATVRNPWQRMISMYFWLIQKQPGHQGEVTFDKQRFLELVDKMTPMQGYVCTHRWHYNPLLGRIMNPLSLSPVSLYLRQEHLQSDYEKLCTKLNMEPQQLPSLNLSRYDDWKTYYDDESRERVAKRFRHEIEHLSYTFS